MKHSESRLFIGKAGEYRVAAELLLRGFRPAMTIVDDGVDIHLSNGICIQVKSSHLTGQRNKNSKLKCYHFHAQNWKRGGLLPHGLDGVDFLIMWGIETDEFWIVPKAVVKGLSTINIFPSNSPPRKQKGGRGSQFNRNDYLGKWDLLNVSK